MSLVSAVNRNCVTMIKSPCMTLLSAPGGVSMIRLVRNLSLDVQSLELESGRKIAYKKLEGDLKPTIVFVPGLHDYTYMDGPKVLPVLRYCEANNHGCIVYDHEGVGRSQGDISKVMFSHWIEAALTVIDKLTVGPVILVGSTMGAWISLKAAQEIAEKEDKEKKSIAEELRAKGTHENDITESALNFIINPKILGLVLCSPALNYVMPYYTEIRKELPAEIQAKLDAGEPCFHNHPKFGKALIRKDFAEDSLKYHIDFEKEVKVPKDIPVKILTSLDDDLVSDLKKLTNSLSTDDVELVARKSANFKELTMQDEEICLSQLNRLIMDNPVTRGEEEEGEDKSMSN